MSLYRNQAFARLQNVPERFYVFVNTVKLLRISFSVLRNAIGIVLIAFLIHQLFFWLSSDPERAFDDAALFLDVLEFAWDLFGLLWNALADIANSALIPLWNAFSFYVTEPALTLILEVFSLIFLRRPYEGIISEDSLPYGGFTCDSSIASGLWCGRFQAYNAKLSNSEGNAFSEQSFVLGTETARRLSELAGNEEPVVPAFDTGEITEALDGLASQAIVLGASVADVGASVLYEILETSAVFLFDALYTIVKILFEVLKQIVKSGFLQTLITIGVDFIIIMYLEIYIPLLFAMIDAVICLFQFFVPNTWDEQLKCMEAKCFVGPDAAADAWIFSSVPVVVDRFASILDSLINSRTAKMFITNGKNIDIGISGLFESLFPTLTAGGCASCLTCKFPELRALWYVVAMSVSILTPENFELFHGNVTEHCMTNGSFYTEVLCGPRGSEALPFADWKAQFPQSYAEFDVDIVQGFAGWMAQRSEELGGAATAAGGQALLAADAWNLRDPALPHEEQAALFHWHMCRAMRQSDAGANEDETPHQYDQFTGGSIASITSQWAFASCKRYKHKVYGDIARAAHDFGLELAMCLVSPVDCKKDFELCLGTCAGDDSSTLAFDFATLIGRGELSPDVLGEDGFAAAAANCTLKTRIIEVPLFDGGESFATYVTRLRIRSGMSTQPPNHEHTSTNTHIPTSND